MANDRRKSSSAAQYFLGRDVASSAESMEGLWEKSLDQQAGINKYRGIGRGVGLLGGLLMAGSGAGIPLLALAGGLGSFTGSQIGKHLGKARYGAPAEAGEDRLFHRDIAEKQRESVGDYWKGMKEQIAANTVQDAITAGMYGSQIQNFVGNIKNIPSSLSSRAADLGFDKTAFRLGGQPAGMAMPPSVEASRATLQQPNVSGVFPDIPTRLKLPEVIHDPSAYPTASTAATSGYSTKAPSQTYENIISYPDVGVPPERIIDPNLLDIEQFDDSPINTGERRTLQILDNAGQTDGVIGAAEDGLNFGTQQWDVPIDANRVNISTDIRKPYEDPLNLGLGKTQGQITPSLTGDMQQRIAYYKDNKWKLDNTIDKSMWDAWSNNKNIVPQKSQPTHNFLNQAVGAGPTGVQKSYNQNYLQQLLEQSKYFRR